MADEDDYAAGTNELDADALGIDSPSDKGNEEELRQLKARLAQMEAEANKLRGHPEGGEEDKAANGEEGEGEDSEAKAEADARSIYVGNVDYACTPEELQLHFQGCGTVNRVTILTDRAGNAKGFAYIEFLEVDAVQNAILMGGTELRGRQIKVNPKRTNVPGFKQPRGRGRGFRGGFYGGRGYGRRGGYYGYPPRGRRGRGYYAPY